MNSKDECEIKLALVVGSKDDFEVADILGICPVDYDNNVFIIKTSSFANSALLEYAAGKEIVPESSLQTLKLLQVQPDK